MAQDQVKLKEELPSRLSDSWSRVPAALMAGPPAVQRRRRWLWWVGCGFGLLVVIAGLSGPPKPFPAPTPAKLPTCEPPAELVQMLEQAKAQAAANESQVAPLPAPRTAPVQPAADAASNNWPGDRMAGTSDKSSLVLRQSLDHLRAQAKKRTRVFHRPPADSSFSDDDASIYGPRPY